MFKPIVWLACLAPLAFLIYDGFTDNLTANPVEKITNTTGIWTLRLVVATIAITPLRWLTGINQLVNYRRLIGLFAFFYGSLHFLVYVFLDQALDLSAIFLDIAKRPFITVGMATFVILFLLGITSNRFAMRKLGRRWQRLHRLVYVAGILAVVHFWWLVKADITLPRRWAFAIGSLLLFRIWWANRGRLSLRS